MDIQKRLQELEAGLGELQQQQQRLAQQQQNVTAAIFRQEGAILVLREVLQGEAQSTSEVTAELPPANTPKPVAAAKR